MSRILVIAAEASADRLASRVISEAKKIGVTEFFGIGGEKCKAEGMQCFYTPTEMSVVGFLEVAKRYGFFKRVFAEMVALLDDPKTRPDKILLVDYPGFNIRFAAEAKKRNIEVIYFVSPQVWAWKPSRVQKMVATVSRMLVIFPFEVDIYKKAGLAQTEFVGHPLVEIIDEEKKNYVSREAFANKYQLNATQGWLLVFAGSRSEEVRRHLNIMCKAAEIVASKLNVQPIVVESPTVSESLYSTAPKSFSHFRNAEDTHQLMNHAQLGILKSGTTTLEAALAGLPG
ncbi:MAG TPA: lipid-A-disaccharide synthase, partial [Candidatus Kapabacteria bacterium]|nr:lipid-A-disaccharide synthase [Candidatus Kapabacteria bacterium]